MKNALPLAPRPDRRTVLQAGMLGTFGLATAFEALLANVAAGRPLRDDRGSGGYGPLMPVPDERTGLPLIQLPSGFHYWTFGWARDPLTAGGVTPAVHDGMGVVDVDEHGVITLVRNHELNGAGNAFGPAKLQYDARARGGTTRLRFDARNDEWLTSEFGVSGTSRNCAGGTTPWGSWLTCEEIIAGRNQGFRRSHGWIFEVPGAGDTLPIPLRQMGRFSHEAVCVDPRTGFVYETEDDRYTSGFYRFRPNRPNEPSGLQAGGALEMLKVEGVDNADLMLVSPGDTFAVEWVPIANPLLALQNGVGPYGSFDGQTTQASGPFFQGFGAGGAQFRRLEGCWYDDAEGAVYFTDTEGGVPVGSSPRGSLFRYDPHTEELHVVLATLPGSVLRNPDNITVTPSGGVLMCEDSGVSGTRLIGLSPDGELFPFAQNAVVLNGEINGFSGGFRRSEWCGATFDPSGRWLFVNIQRPGITFAITGPWKCGPL